jgi:hypothetical protein
MICIDKPFKGIHTFTQDFYTTDLGICVEEKLPVSPWWGELFGYQDPFAGCPLSCSLRSYINLVIAKHPTWDFLGFETEGYQIHTYFVEWE